jgi:hypothetical protein
MPKGRQLAVLLRGTVMVAWNEGTVFTVWRRLPASGWRETATFFVPGVRDVGEATILAVNYVDNTGTSGE